MMQGGYQWGAAPAPAVTTTVAQVPFNAGCFKMFGAVLALLAAATLALGIADVVMTMQTYCTPWNTAAPVWCTMTGEPYIWTWVASGIWGSVPIFLAGLFSMCISSNPVGYTRIFALLIILSGIVFAPAIIVLTSIELWRGSTSVWTFYNMGNSTSVSAGSIMPNPNPYQAKFAIPLVIAILAGIMFLMTGIVTLNICCCMESMGIYLQPEVAVAPPPVVQQTVVAAPQPPAVVTKEVFYPPRPQVRTQTVEYQADDSYDPYSRFSVLPYATRYNNVPNPYGSGVMYGKFPSRAPAGNSFASDFFQPNPAYFWK